MQLVGPARDAEVSQRLLELVAGGDTLSVAIGEAGDDKKPAVYLVEQYDKDVDAAAEVNAFWTAAGKLDHDLKPLSIYDAGGKTVTRAVLADDKAASHLNLDVLQNGRTVFITLSPSDGHIVDQLAKAGAKGELAAGTVMTASIDVGQVALTLQELLPEPLPPPVVALTTSLIGDPIAWTSQISAQGKYIYTDISLPTDAVKEIVQLAMMAGGPGPGGPGRMGGPPGGAGMQPQNMGGPGNGGSGNGARRGARRGQ
jgi:hypothetical protein